MTTKKREYVPANIRAGYKVAEAVARLNKNGFPVSLGGFRVRVTSYDHSRDVNGNGTSHYKCELVVGEAYNGLLTIVRSGKRREQVGYGSGNEAALYALAKLGYEVDTSKAGNDDFRGTAAYPLLNFPPVEG